eukprot:CAMPEP_0114281724 /NCGR_PEP_ID=MMETSP0059-20121206/3165_1 /TAXON_ID=36894 /ORGANISM="Pyramimonas parkeae, Strain CCMP726" /LENGTH=543 /DNA_ID=CAMNT_0001402293 /DNA_START=325 /DNA_END=1956 /DNA_ORIENTATION=-
MTREQSLVDIENNPRLRAAQDHTWTWKTNTQGMGLDEDAPLPLPSFAELGPFAQVLKKDLNKSSSHYKSQATSPGSVSKMPPARRRQLGGKTGNKSVELDSLLLTTMMEEHAHARSEHLLHAEARGQWRRSTESLSPTHKSKSGRVTANQRATPPPGNLDWDERPANVDIAFLPGKVPPLGEYDARMDSPGLRSLGSFPPPEGDTAVPPAHHAMDLDHTMMMGQAYQEWGLVGEFQWAPAPARLQAWPRLRQVPEPGTKIHRKQMEELNRIDILVKSFQRASNMATKVAEARAHFRAGVIYENLNKFSKALDNYNLFLLCMQTLGDAEGVALAHNCLGVAYQRLAMATVQQQQEEDDNQGQISTLAQMNYEKALENHLKHLAITDTVGQLVAHTNLGLMSSNLGQKKAAAYSHEQAIKCSVQLTAPQAERAAVGNMAFLLMEEEHFEDCRPFMERYVSVCCSLGDKRGQVEGHMALGRAARAVNELEASASAFESALRAAQAAGDQNRFNEAKVLLGITRGELKFVEMSQTNNLPIGLKHQDL